MLHIVKAPVRDAWVWWPCLSAHPLEETPGAGSKRHGDKFNPSGFLNKEK